MPEGYRSRLITLPESLWEQLDAETKAEKRHGCSKQLEVILEDRYKEGESSNTNASAKKSRRVA